MLQLVDTHCHIQSAGVDNGEPVTRQIWAKNPDLQADSLVVGAQQADVNQLICVGCDLSDSKLAIDFVQNQQNCWATIGIHPHEATLYAANPTSLQEFSSLLTPTDRKIVAIGECGLDYYYAHSPKEAQLEILKFQLVLAQTHDLPVIFHVRDAFDDFWPIFDQFPGIRGVAHSFTDSIDNLNQALERGLFIGVNGIATFSKDQTQQEVYTAIPLEKMVFETDAPFLTPIPYRGTINEPKHIREIAEFMAKLRGVSLEMIADVTTNNARTLFGIL